MTNLPLTLHKTYYENGFFNVTVAFDHLACANDGPVHLIPDGAPTILGKVDRHANLNGTARIFGGVELRNWFQKNFELDDVIQVEFVSDIVIRLYK